MPQAKYNVDLETVGKKYTAKNENLEEAIRSLGLSWEQIKAKGVIKIQFGKKSVEHLFYITQLKRIFANKLTLQMWTKRLQTLLK
jgi:hypothetical protein